MPHFTSPLQPETRAYSPMEMGEAALAGFFFIAERWGLDTREQLALLGQPARSTFFAWKKSRKAVLPQDTLERISYLLGIWKALRILIPDGRQAEAWVKRPNDNPLFEGEAPIVRLTRGQIMDLADVRRLLDARRGVW
jgi:hypothetical protein